MSDTPDQDERARRLHDKCLIADFSPHGEPIPHTPRTAAAMAAGLERGGLPAALGALWDEYLREIEEDGDAYTRRREEVARGGVDSLQVTLGAIEMSMHDWDAGLRDAARWRRRAAIGGDVEVCETPAALRAAREAGRVGVMLGLQDTLQIGSDLRRLEMLRDLGVRVVQLTYNRRNLVGDGCTEPHQSGLSRFGVELVRELNELGIVVDVSHCGDGTTMEAIDVSARPIAFTHTACRALYDHPRAKTDEQLRALAERDGYVGIVAVPFFLKAAGAGIPDAVAHVAHAAEIVGIENVGIGTDWGFWTTDWPAELRPATLRALGGAGGFRPEDGLELGIGLGPFVEWGDRLHLTRGLLDGGFSDAEIAGLLGENWLCFLERF
ncbi:MAG: membrane dipeptidase [Actinobacteria bacterium]|nr:membrane dipeptidase [Actinomycetota bacterium]